jgi:hypothetical protein
MPCKANDNVPRVPWILEPPNTRRDCLKSVL